MERVWLMFDGSIWYEGLLRMNGWNDETLRAPHACRVRERVVITDRHGGYVSSVNKPEVSVTNFKPTHIYTGSHSGRNGKSVYLAERIIKRINGDLRMVTFSDGWSMYVLTTQVEPITEDTKRDELIDDIEALCLSIEKRQSELSRLVKELKC